MHAEESSTFEVMAEPHPSVVGLADIARRLGVSRATVDQWKWRKVLPEPRWTVSDRPAWDWADIEAWAKETGRL
jgi:predicted DNA-binding transcriptional regulator AlpA